VSSAMSEVSATVPVEPAMARAIFKHHTGRAVSRSVAVAGRGGRHPPLGTRSEEITFPTPMNSDRLDMSGPRSRRTSGPRRSRR
jgi:hypothetical protein